MQKGEDSSPGEVACKELDTRWQSDAFLYNLRRLAVITRSRHNNQPAISPSTVEIFRKRNGHCYETSCEQLRVRVGHLTDRTHGYDVEILLLYLPD